MIKNILALIFSIGLISSSNCFAQRYRGMNVSPDVTIQDIQDLYNGYGAKMVRFQMYNGSEDTQNKEQYLAWVSSVLAKLDGLLPTFSSLNMKVVLDLHSAPGGTANFGTYSSARIFQDSDWQATFIEAWQLIAAKYKDNSTILWYELMNEPRERNTPAGLLNWSQLAQKTAEEIRKIDTTHGFVISSIDGDSGKLSRLKALKGVGPVYYSVHMYNPLSFLHQGLYSRPSNVSFPKGKFNEKSVEEKFEKIIKFHKKNKKYSAGIFFGEFSTSRYAPGKSGLNYLKATIKVLEKNKFHWAYHAWRESETWSVEHEQGIQNTTRSATKTDRGLLLEKYFRK